MESTHSVHGGKVMSVEYGNGRVVLEMFRSDKFNGEEWDGFRPCKILIDGKVAWSYEKGTGMTAELYSFYGGDIVVIGTSRCIYKAIRMESLVSATAIMFAGKPTYTGGTDTMEQVLDLKIEIANKRGHEFHYTDEEGEILRRKGFFGKKPAKQDKPPVPQSPVTTTPVIPKDNSAKLAKNAEREAYRQAVLRRPQVEAWGRDGHHFFGTPVMCDRDWQCLPDGKYCIMMKDGKPIEAFKVNKIGNRATKEWPREVFATPPSKDDVTKNATAEVEVIDMISVLIRDERRTGVPLVQTMTDLKQLNLHPGSWCAVMNKDGNNATVHEVNGKHICAKGEVKVNLKIAA